MSSGSPISPQQKQTASAPAAGSYSPPPFESSSNYLSYFFSPKRIVFPPTTICDQVDLFLLYVEGIFGFRGTFLFFSSAIVEGQVGVFLKAGVRRRVKWKVYGG